MTEYEKEGLVSAVKLVPVLFVIFALLAYVQRGYFAIGGEITAILYPVFVLVWRHVSGF